MSTVLAGPNAARYLADFGADVIKVERPGGDGLRDMAWRDPRDDVGLWWKVVNRNKRAVVLDVKHEADREVLLGLLDEADVFVENSRPGTLERLGLGPDVLLARNDALVITRVTGFGQDGPYASRPGFATIAEAMSGLGVAQRRARRPAAAPADRAHRRGHRPGGGVRHDGRAALGRRAGDRRQPAGDDVPADGSARVALRGARRTAASARGRTALHGAARHVSVQRRSLGGAVDVERVGGATGDRGARSRRRRALPRLRRPCRSPRRAGSDHGRVVCPKDAGRGARHPHRGRGRGRVR